MNNDLYQRKATQQLAKEWVVGTRYARSVDSRATGLNNGKNFKRSPLC